MQIWETRIPSQRQILQECLYTISTPWAAMPSNRWQAMSMAQNKNYGRDCLFFRNQRLSHIHDIMDVRETLRECVLPEAPSFLPSAGALSLKAWDQIKEDVSSIPGDSFLGV